MLVKRRNLFTNDDDEDDDDDDENRREREIKMRNKRETQWTRKRQSKCDEKLINILIRKKTLSDLCASDLLSLLLIKKNTQQHSGNSFGNFIFFNQTFYFSFFIDDELINDYCAICQPTPEPA